MLDKKGNVIIYSAEKLYPYALRKLGARAHSCYELAEKMSRLQPDVTIVNAIIDKLKSQNYLNDIAYVRMVFNTYFKKEGLSKIRNRLIQKGVNKEDIEQGLAECISELDDSNAEAENALSLLIRKYKVFNQEHYMKYMRFLASKQFSSHAMKYAINTFKSKAI